MLVNSDRPEQQLCRCVGTDYAYYRSREPPRKYVGW